ncbi:MAG TPA: hypothetical protein VFM76_08220 [Methylophaga sp.]|nr:hypothetical protein [Methylophaga sp.]
MSDLSKALDLSMFGCPVHKTKALQAAATLEAAETLRIKLNNDAVNTVVKHLQENGFQCHADAPDVITTIVKVTKND